MPFFDLPLEQLETYRPDIREPDDVDDFWNRTLAMSRAAATDVVLRRHDAALTEVEVFDVTFPGFAGEPVRAWYLRPAHAPGPLPAVVTYVGYGGGRGVPTEHLAWPAAGYAHFVMDTRGQGSGWGAGGDTPDPHGAGPSTPGFMTRGIESPETYYYRRVFADAVRAVDVVRGFDEVDADRVVVSGASQGGGIALAVAGLARGLAGVLADVPFLSHFDRAVGLTTAGPYAEISRFLSIHRDMDDVVFRTLGYFDTVCLVRRAVAPALYSVALMDTICPPSTVYASRNAYAAASRIVAYRFNEHEGGGGRHWQLQAEWLRELLG